jgi:AcrR family transcriptional regulator
MKVPKSTDRRVLRTRATLRDALIALIMERGWDAITIQDVCVRANVGRSTFYTHFADKEELLISGFDDLRRMLQLVARTNRDRGGGLAFTRALFEHAAENKRLFRALVGKKSGQAVQRRFLEVILELTEEELAQTLDAGVERDATVHYIAGALFQLVIWWVDSRKPLLPADIDAIFGSRTAGILRAVRRST